MKFFRAFLLWIHFLYQSLFFLRYIPSALRYSLKRDRAESQFRASTHTGSLTSPGILLEVTSTHRGARFRFEQAELEIDFLMTDLVRVTWLPGLAPVPYAIVEQEWEKVKTTLTQTDNGWTIASEAMQITISPEGSLMMWDSTRTLIRKERSPQRQGEGWIHQADLFSDERIYGLGERATSLNLRVVPEGSSSIRTYQMWNYDPGGVILLELTLCISAFRCIWVCTRQGTT